MKVLTFIGKTGSLPFDTKIVERGKMIEGADDGDKIVSYFTIDGVNYASHFGECSLANGTIGKAMPDSKLPVRTGFLKGDEVNYAIYHEGRFNKVIWLRKYPKGGNTLWEGKLGEVVNIEDNPYYSLPPYWPDTDNWVATPYGKIPTANNFNDRYLYNFIKFIDWLPKYYTQGSLELEIVEGNGKFALNKTDISKSTYQFSNDDIERKRIKLKISCEPLINSGSKDTYRILIFKW